MPFLVLDLEMTGGDPGWHEIIQIGAVLYDDNWKELGQYLTNVYPENEESVSDYAEKIHGLSLIDLDDAPMMHDVLPLFEDWIIDKLHLRKMKRRATWVSSRNQAWRPLPRLNRTSCLFWRRNQAWRPCWRCGPRRPARAPEGPW